MRIVCIADTHGKHRLLKLPHGDMIIHAGDVSFEGSDHQTEDFLKWFSHLDYQHKIFIAGNHDFYLEDLTSKQLAKTIPPNVVYLNDSGVEIEGLHIWGSPVTPWNFDWAFNKQRGRDITKHWKLIPPDTNVLITHSPPATILDKIKEGHHIGCESLLKTVKNIKPRLHVFGHIHEGYGLAKNADCMFINASVMDENFKLKNKPVVWGL